MKRLRRKKSSDNISGLKQNDRDNAARVSGDKPNDTTPLYARFATSRRDSPSSNIKPLVSGPLMLTPKSSGNLAFNPATEKALSTPPRQNKRMPNSNVSATSTHDPAHIPRSSPRPRAGSSTRPENDRGVLRSPRSRPAQSLDNIAPGPPARSRVEETYNSSPLIPTMMLQAIITTPEPQQHAPLPHHQHHTRDHPLPTPPPSASSISVPQQPVNVDRRGNHTSNVAAPINSGTLNSTQDGPVRRRKYSLLAAFGPLPSSKSGTESNVGTNGSANDQYPSNADVPAPDSSRPSMFGPTLPSLSQMEALLRQPPSPRPTNTQILSPRSDMPALTDDPNTYRNTSSASAAPLPIIPSHHHRQALDLASSAPSSSSVSQIPNWSSMPDTIDSEAPDLDGISKLKSAYLPSSPAAESALINPRAKSSSHAHASRKPQNPRSQDHGTSVERSEHKPVTSNPSSHRSKGTPDAGAPPHGYPAGPVPGRPLIFAAMASADAESIVPVLPEDLPSEEPQPVVHRRPSHFQNGDGEPSQEHPYPSPKSPSPPLPKSKEGERIRVSHSTSRIADHDRAMAQQSSLLRPRMRTQSLPGEEKHVQDLEDVRRSRQAGEPSQEARPAERLGSSHTTTQFVEDLPSKALPAPPEDTFAQPQQAAMVRQETSELGSPIHLHHGRTLSEGRIAEVTPRSRSSQRERSREKDRDTRSKRHSRDGIKLLTERQLERLNSRIANAAVSAGNTNGQGHRKREEEAGPRSPRAIAAVPPVEPPTPISPDDLQKTRTRRRGHRSERARQQIAAELEARLSGVLSGEQPPREPTFYPLAKHLVQPSLLAALLPYLSFAEWCVLSCVSKDARKRSEDQRELREVVLERYLRTVGYSRWAWPEPEPLALSLADLNAYMRGVSMPTHQYAQLASTYAYSSNPAHSAILQNLAASCRAYTRVVLRLRAQAEAMAAHAARHPSPDVVISPSTSARGPSPATPYRTQTGWSASTSRVNPSRSSSRAPSPSSSFTHSRSGHVAARSVDQHGGPYIPTFRSPLFRPRRAPLLQVFVPSPESDWLSDAGVLDCEHELKRAGVLHLMRAGDVVWDTAVGDEGNVGRLVWDGSYLIDLDYTYSRTGDLPQYLPTMAFPPSYFHRVIRTMGSGNPICHIDIAPWSDEIAQNLQLLQDRMKTETPQGGHHTVVRWVHRSTFTIRPPPGAKSIRIPVPKNIGPGPSPTGAWVIDPGWYGTVVVEAEGTNEGLADLQARCRGAFPPRAVGARASPERLREEAKTVFRILRERSRPGEIWIRTVREKERLLPP